MQTLVLHPSIAFGIHYFPWPINICNMFSNMKVKTQKVLYILINWRNSFNLSILFLLPLSLFLAFPFHSLASMNKSSKSRVFSSLNISVTKNRVNLLQP